MLGVTLALLELTVLLAHVLASHLLPTSPIIVTHLTPGYSVSSLRREFLKLMDLNIARSAEGGPCVTVYEALAGEADYNKELQESLKGAYISDYRASEESDWF